VFFAVITLFPEMFEAITAHGISGRAAKRDIVQVNCINPRDFAEGNYKRVDERPFGGGPGMVMMAEPLAKAINHAKQLASQAGCVHAPVVYMSPQGKTLNEQAVQQFVDYDGLIVLCGRYEGVDERLIQHYVDQEWSIGDYVLSGGELPLFVDCQMSCLTSNLRSKILLWMVCWIVHNIQSLTVSKGWMCLRYLNQDIMPILRNGVFYSVINEL